MILWVVLFVLVVAISFVLALNSMRDFQEEVPEAGEDYGLFLIRHTRGLNGLFDQLHDDLFESGLNISFERLFKGKKSALVVFGSRKLLTKYQDFLNLLELEDYTNVDVEGVNAWEVGVKQNGKWTMDNGQLFGSLPSLSDTEQFWWQLILWVNKDNPSTKLFQNQIRAVVLSSDVIKRKNLTQTLQNLPKDLFFKVPKAFSNAQILDFYRKRSFTKKARLPDEQGKNPALNSGQVLHKILWYF